MAAKSQGKPIRHETNMTEKKPESPWDSFSATALEADLAYFQARLEWIGEPKTLNQKAQQDTFRLLVPAIGKILNRLNRLNHLKRKAPAKP